MKLAFSTLGCPEFGWSDVYSMAKDLGFQGIEVRGLGDELFDEMCIRDRLADGYDIEGMLEAGNRHNRLAQKISGAFASLPFGKTLHLGAGGCRVCPVCATRTGEPCRFPDRARASLEDVYKRQFLGGEGLFLAEPAAWLGAIILLVPVYFIRERKYLNLMVDRSAEAD